MKAVTLTGWGESLAATGAGWLQLLVVVVA